VVDLAGDRGGDLDRLHGRAEGPGEDAADRLFEPLLEALQTPTSPPSRRSGPGVKDLVLPRRRGPRALSGS
jgi:hypothetical protein